MKRTWGVDWGDIEVKNDKVSGRWKTDMLSRLGKIKLKFALPSQPSSTDRMFVNLKKGGNGSSVHDVERNVNSRRLWYWHVCNPLLHCQLVWRQFFFWATGDWPSASLLNSGNKIVMAIKKRAEGHEQFPFQHRTRVSSSATWSN